MKKWLKNGLRHAIWIVALANAPITIADDDPADTLNNVNEMIDSMSFNNDELSACGAVMCLFAWADECNEYLNPFFAIEIFTATPPRFDPSETLDARKIFLRLCGGASNGLINDVNNSKRGGFQNTGVFDAEGNQLTYRDIYLLERLYDIDINDNMDN